MPRPARRALWLAAAVSVGCGIAWGIYPLSNAAERLRAVPLHAGEFAGRDVALTEAEKKVLGRVDVVHRRYAFADRAVYVTLIDGSRDRHAVHDPRYCFQGAGWRLLDEARRPVAGGEAAWLRAQNDRGVAEAAFWFSDGVARHASLGRYLWNSVVRRATFGRVGDKPVLVVLQAFDGEPLGQATLDALIRDLKL
ncbi:MAG: hypothetical protein C0518_16220 [Opitutus sp.]|nr:hypothetical protein [Opitutus sp.]